MIDSHAHIAFEQFDKDRDQVIKRAHQAGITGWLEIGTDLTTSRSATELTENVDRVFAAVGIHPADTAGLTEANWGELEDLSRHKHVVAIGEVGLDFYRGGTAVAQLPVLGRLIKLARKRNLPLVFHVRDGADSSAHQKLIEYLVSLPKTQRPSQAVIHTFSGTAGQAKQYLAFGFHLGISGVITFKNAGQLSNIVTDLPLDRILIETDCPFLAPEPHRGQRNEPAYLSYIAAKIAALKNISDGEVTRAATQNTRNLFQVF